MPQNKKDDHGRLYGIRLRSWKDKKIKTELKKLSKHKNIPLDRLILDYLEKGINVFEEKEINIDKKGLIEDFEIFLRKIRKKNLSYKNALKMKNFEKKEALKNYIYNKYPGEIQKKKFFLELLETQIKTEVKLLIDFFSLYNYKTNEYVGYCRYICESRKVLFTTTNCNEIINEYLTNLYFQWYYELKTAGVIRDINDFKNLEKIKDFDNIINYDALEVFVFDLYEGKKLLYSSKEETIRVIDKFNKSSEKTIKTKSLSSHLKQIFREIVKYYNGLSNEILHLKESEYQLFHKIGYKPLVFYKILDLDGYINFIEENNLRRVLTESFYDKLLLYMQFNDFYSFPPLELLTNISLFSSYLDKINEFLGGLPELIKQKAYSLDDIYRIGVYIARLKSKPPMVQIQCKKLLNGISVKNIDEFSNIMPENYEKTFNFVKDYLLKHDIDLDSFMDQITQTTEKTLSDERLMFFNSYPERIKTKIDKSLKEFENRLKNNNDKIKG